MAKRIKSVGPSNDSTHFNAGKTTVGGWFYEYRGRIDVVVEGGRGPILSIPWRKIIAAAKRCRPEEFSNAR